MKISRPILLIGCGKMGSAMLSGWLESGIAGGGVFVVEPTGAPAEFDGVGGVSVVADAEALPRDLNPEVVVFAVKPQQMDDVAPEYKKFVGSETAFLSIAAGKDIVYFQSKLGEGASIVRAMPNTPAAIGQGITVCCSNVAASDDQRELCRSLLAATGEAVVVDDEDLIDAVTAVSGGGPAYVFLLIECLAAAGVAAGLPTDLSAKLALMTVAGSGQLALSSEEPPSVLRENVTSPGGTTLEALKILMADDGLEPLMIRAIAAATQRSRELAG
jgi:pyrroline-5-carboxylate reductase